MPSENRFLVVGSGSAGRRHALGLRELFPTSKITVVKRSQSTQPLAVLHERGIEIVDSLERGIELDPTFSVIASPATLHFTDFEFLSRHCSRFLLEKPIASSTRDGQLIHSLATSRGIEVVL
ncbi:MAG: Gfo/Idh/MocA family oxidoreductase, partial [Candidatus Nanopelagicaceae bacterium]